MTKKVCILILFLITAAFCGISLIAQETPSGEDESKSSTTIKFNADLLDSEDYVVVLISGKKVRVRMKPVVKEDSDLVWMFVRKKTGEYSHESINKGLVDYEKTEEYNRILSAERKQRKIKIAQEEAARRKKIEEENMRSGQLPNQGDSAKKVYTQWDLTKKSVATKAIYVTDIPYVDDLSDWNITIITENENYKEIVFSLNKGNGEVIFTTAIKDILSLRDDLQMQTQAYKTKVQELYDQGTAEGDKYKYSGKIVEIQVLLQDYDKKMTSIEKIIGKLPPKPEDNSGK